MVPEDILLETDTRKLIDEIFEASGWVIQDKNRINLYESLGVAVQEVDADLGSVFSEKSTNGSTDVSFGRGKNT